ncbi:MAG: hypothetical protein MUP58_00580 [Candidatus Nanohaloarchaeota archaeon QJJ-9]|nr:hypothetical protein [Candidatus Nanohaloarchaeota archaeon QJJ-9]
MNQLAMLGMNWAIAILAGSGLAYFLKPFKESVISGIISMVISLVITTGIAQLIPTGNLNWALIAVGYVGFFSGMISYVNGVKSERGKKLWG